MNHYRGNFWDRALNMGWAPIDVDGYSSDTGLSYSVGLVSQISAGVCHKSGPGTRQRKLR